MVVLVCGVLNDWARVGVWLLKWWDKRRTDTVHPNRTHGMVGQDVDYFARRLEILG